MKLTFSPSNTLDIEANDIYLRGAHPVGTSIVLQDARAEIILNEPNRQVLRYQSSVLGEGTFSLEIRRDASLGRLWLQYWIEGLDPERWHKLSEE